MLQQRMNVFDKPCKQNDACINFAVARKRGAKFNISTLLPLQSKESFGGFCYVHTTNHLIKREQNKLACYAERENGGMKSNSMSIVARDWYTRSTLVALLAKNTFQRTSPKRKSDWTA
jgi:hypothetical protein